MFDRPQDPDATIALAEEHPTVGKRQVETGRFWVRAVTDNETVNGDASLFDHGISIKHVPVGREVTETPAIRQDGETTIIPVLEDVLVVAKRLVPIGETNIRLTIRQTNVTEPVIVRRQRTEIVRTAAGDISTEE